jgi:competence protein ComGC
VGYGFGYAGLVVSRNKRAEKNEKSMVEFIMVIIIFAVLMKIFINYFSEQEQHITTTGFTTISQNFNNTVVAVHAQWFMDNQPSIVWLGAQDKKDKVAVTVNKRGWLDISKKTIKLTNITPCENIWQLAMTIPMKLMKFSIAAIELRDKEVGDFNHCRYLLPSGEYFEYYSETGKVTKVSQMELN